MKLISKIVLGSIVFAQLFYSCKSDSSSDIAMDSNFITLNSEADFPIKVTQFADLKVIALPNPRMGKFNS